MLDQTVIVIITKNSAPTLQKTLDSVLEYNEVVIYDNGSEDETLGIVANFNNVSLYRGSFMGFGPPKTTRWV